MNMELFGKPNATPIDSVMEPPRIVWGAATAAERGPVIATLRDPRHRNAVGTHAGGYSVYRALAIAAKTLKPDQLADLTDTAPAERISGRYPQWADAKKIVSLDPWGHLVGEEFRDYLARGYDIRPTIAVTRANIDMPEIRAGDRRRPHPGRRPHRPRERHVRVVKAAIDPVWYLPGIAERFGIDEAELRHGLHEQTGGMYPELVNRRDLKVFLPPIGGTTIYCFGDPQKLARPQHAARLPRARRVQRLRRVRLRHLHLPALSGARHRDRIQMAQAGGVGLVVYNRKEGRALGEVTKFLVYNARKRQKGGDRPEGYFHRTACVAGVEDMRFQELMPDVLHWLGITPHPPLRLDERHEVRRAHPPGHRHRRARADPGRADPAGCARRDRGQDRGRLFRRRQAARRFRRHGRAGARRVMATASRGRSRRRRIRSERSAAAIAALRSAAAVRERCRMVHDWVAAGPLAALHASSRPACGGRRLTSREVTRDAYPDLRIPYHSRWRHFVGGRRRSLAASWRRNCRPIRSSGRARRSISRP